MPIGSIQHLPEWWVSEETTVDTEAIIGRWREVNNPANPVVLWKSVRRRRPSVCPNYFLRNPDLQLLALKARELLPRVQHSAARLQDGTRWATGITGWTVAPGQPIVALRGRKESNPRTDERSPSENRTEFDRPA